MASSDFSLSQVPKRLVARLRELVVGVRDVVFFGQEAERLRLSLAVNRCHVPLAWGLDHPSGVLADLPVLLVRAGEVSTSRDLFCGVPAELRLRPNACAAGLRLL